jgi:copper chaperone
MAKISLPRFLVIFGSEKMFKPLIKLESYYRTNKRRSALRKLLVMSLMLTAILAIAMAPAVVAGDGCPASKVKGKADNVSEAAKHCTPEEVAACAKAAGMSPEECAKLCGDNADCGFVVLSISGMTCGGCEKTIETALGEVEGVRKVIKVSHEDGKAWVCYEANKVETAVLANAVTKTGYKAEVIPAVAKSADVGSIAGCSKACVKTCTTKEKAKCDTKKSSGSL